MKKVLALLLTVVLIFGLSGSAFAKPTPSKPASANKLGEKVKARNDKLEEYLKTSPITDVGVAINAFIQNNRIDTSACSVEDLADLHDKSLVKTVAIDDKNIVEFYDNGGFGLSSLTEEDVSKSVAPLVSSIVPTILKASNQVSAMYGPYYKKAGNTYTYYSTLGNWVYRIHIEAVFGYNGSYAWYDSGLYGYYDKSTLCMWRVENWVTNHEAINSPYANAYCQAYARGYFYFGFEYIASCVIADMNENTWVKVKYDGTVSWSPSRN